MLSPFGLSTEPTVSRDPPVSDEGRHQLLANATKNKFPKIVDVDYPTTGEGLKTKFKNKKETAGFLKMVRFLGSLLEQRSTLVLPGCLKCPRDLPDPSHVTVEETCLIRTFHCRRHPESIVVRFC